MNEQKESSMKPDLSWDTIIKTAEDKGLGRACRLAAYEAICAINDIPVEHDDKPGPDGLWHLRIALVADAFPEIEEAQDRRMAA